MFRACLGSKTSTPVLNLEGLEGPSHYGDSFAEEAWEDEGSSDGNEYVTKEAPIGEDGFVVDFEPDNVHGARKFFEEYGFVVMRNVLTDAEVAATIDEFWARGATEGLDRADPKTWEKYFDGQRFGHLGIIGMYPDLFSLRQLENRQNPRVHTAFSTILGTERLWVDHDRLGVMRPTRNVHFGEEAGTKEDLPHWRTKSRWLHLDINPYSVQKRRIDTSGGLGMASIAGYANDGSPIDFSTTLLLQSLITLSDAKVEDGGFHCVPGSHRFTLDWAAKASSQRRSSAANMLVGDSDPLQGRIQKIPIRKGCLLCWDSRLLHGNHPNNSSNFRVVQYIRAMPTVGTPYTPLAMDRSHYPDGFEPTPLGATLFGFEGWSEKESIVNL